MSVSIKGNELAAKRWAKALMELALENDGISKEDILDDLREVNENIENSRELYEVLKNFECEKQTGTFTGNCRRV